MSSPRAIVFNRFKVIYPDAKISPERTIPLHYEMCLKLYRDPEYYGRNIPESRGIELSGQVPERSQLSSRKEPGAFISSAATKALMQAVSGTD